MTANTDDAQSAECKGRAGKRLKKIKRQKKVKPVVIGVLVVVAANFDLLLLLYFPDWKISGQIIIIIIIIL